MAAKKPDRALEPPAGRFLPEKTAEALHDYLLTRPMREVETLVVLLRQTPPCPEPR